MHASARHLSENTVRDYINTFHKFRHWLGADPALDSITHIQVEGFLSSQTVSNKTLLNYHIALSALWTWAVAEELATEHVIRRVVKPKPEQPDIIPFTELDIRAMLAAIGKSRSYHRPGKRETAHTLPNAERHHAMLLLMLDTGIRVTELCNLAIKDCDLKNYRIIVWGKGAKERQIPFSPRTAQVIWRYLAARPNARLDEPLLASDGGRPLERYNILHILERIGERAGVSNVHPHRFRHTFAILYLRNGGDPFTLQRILGHSTLTMVNRYLSIAQADLANAHRRASPVDNLRL